MAYKLNIPFKNLSHDLVIKLAITLDPNLDPILAKQIEAIDDNWNMGLITEHEHIHQIIEAATIFHNGLTW